MAHPRCLRALAAIQMVPLEAHRARVRVLIIHNHVGGSVCFEKPAFEPISTPMPVPMAATAVAGAFAPVPKHASVTALATVGASACNVLKPACIF